MVSQAKPCVNPRKLWSSTSSSRLGGRAIVCSCGGVIASPWVEPVRKGSGAFGFRAPDPFRTGSRLDVVEGVVDLGYDVLRQGDVAEVRAPLLAFGQAKP